MVLDNRKSCCHMQQLVPLLIGCSFVNPIQYNNGRRTTRIVNVNQLEYRIERFLSFSPSVDSLFWRMFTFTTVRRENQINSGSGRKFWNFVSCSLLSVMGTAIRLTCHHQQRRKNRVKKPDGQQNKQLNNWMICSFRWDNWKWVSFDEQFTLNAIPYQVDKVVTHYIFGLHFWISLTFYSLSNTWVQCAEHVT